LFTTTKHKQKQELGMDLKLNVLRIEVKQYRKESPRLLERILALIELTKLRDKYGRVTESDYERLALRLEISGRTVYRWEAAYRKGGIQALMPKKSCGRPAASIRGYTAKKILEMRKLYNWGAEVIQAHLKHNHGVNLSRYKINQYLRKKGLLLRKKCKARKKHPRVVHVDHPGQHTQTDVKHLPHFLPNQKKCYVYNFIDHASKWSYKRSYDSYGPSETKDFMHWVIQAAPFTIKRLQSDNGVEFTFKYLSLRDDPKLHALGQLCESQGIRHVLIPPGEKELQGLVERSHRQDDEELFHRIRPKNLEEFNKILATHCQWRNSKRRRKALGWKSSDEFLADYQKRIDNWLYENGASPFKIQEEKMDTEECVSSDKKAA
jgi:transposase